MVRYENVKVTNLKKEIVEKWRDRNITKTITVERLKVREKIIILIYGLDYLRF
jgi:hypothetical protein